MRSTSDGFHAVQGIELGKNEFEQTALEEELEAARWAVGCHDFLQLVNDTFAGDDLDGQCVIDEIGEKREEFEFDIDGAVVKIDQVAYRNDFSTSDFYCIVFELLSN